MVKIIYEPAVEPKENGDGGERRCYQIMELLQRRFILIQPRKEKYEFESRFKRYYYGVKFLISAGLPLKSLRNIAVAGYTFTNLKRVLEKYGDINFVVWESTISHPYKFYIYKALGLKLICFPHNLESLVSEQSSPVTKQASLNWLFEEMNAYKLNEITFAISREEYWLLSIFNVKSLYFPYYPSKKIESELLEIREYRMENIPEDFVLIFGSYSYTPIQKGINEIIEAIIKKEIDSKFIITGFDSELIFDKFDKLPSNIKVKGFVERAELIQLLKTCKAIFINQSVSSGALTKVIEQQIAGIPMIINDVSIRSYDIVPGMKVFHSIEDFDFSYDDLSIPPLPDSIKCIENEVLNEIATIIQ